MSDIMMQGLLKMVVGFVGKDKLQAIFSQILTKVLAEKNNITLHPEEDDVVVILYSDTNHRPCSVVAVTAVEELPEGIKRTFIARSLDPVYLDELAEKFIKNV